jgi:hypothetical protein
MRSTRIALVLGVAAVQMTAQRAAGPGSPAPSTLPPNVRAQSRFRFGTEGWTLEGADEQWSAITLDGASGKILVHEQGGKTWYFVAPSAFVGDVSSTYNGKLVFALGHAYFNADEEPYTANEPDVILETTCGYSLQKNVFSAFVMHKVYALALNEFGGWIDTRTRAAPGLMDFLGALSNLKSIKIRGGYYPKDEIVSLGPVELHEGARWVPCCNPKDEVDYCTVPGSPYYNPPSLNFYCLGAWRQEIKIAALAPRFVRKSGGALLTVRGSNFGLPLSQPIVRVDGSVCTLRDGTPITQTQVRCCCQQRACLLVEDWARRSCASHRRCNRALKGRMSL